MTLVKVNNPLAKTFDGIMKDFLNEFPAAVNKTVREEVLHFPPVNIYDKSDKYQLEFAVPGFEKADFNIKLDGQVLTVSIVQKEAGAESNSKLIRREFSQRSFKRSFTIDEKIDAENISAKYEQGILTLDLPKKEDLKAAAKEINVQ